MAKAISEQAVATIEAPAGALTMIEDKIYINGTEYVVTRQVTVPTLSHTLESGKTVVAVEFLTAFHPSDSKIAGAAAGAKTWSARVRNLQDGKEYNYVGGTVILSEINAAFPDETYVGKRLAIEKRPGPSGKRYNSATILEII